MARCGGAVSRRAVVRFRGVRWFAFGVGLVAGSGDGNLLFLSFFADLLLLVPVLANLPFLLISVLVVVGDGLKRGLVLVAVSILETMVVIEWE
ncbi:hypothetical protein TSUD_28900 [Trifolium subterraneum]|uniref:Transmembrane protein n=1 Tax=Trifolium subterraneum TaxID=3900 RepID=A0A2Z6PNC6_TRISU|nr:hypothetical protein TSUD_28900 [Trifolium subterraneum]